MALCFFVLEPRSGTFCILTGYVILAVGNQSRFAAYGSLKIKGGRPLERLTNTVFQPYL